MRRHVVNVLITGLILLGSFPSPAMASELNRPALYGSDVSQSDIQEQRLPLRNIRYLGSRIFSTFFNKYDGYGDGPAGVTPEQRNQPGQRSTLQANGTFLHFNGLDAQSCIECHNMLSTATVPIKFAIGGGGGLNSSVIGAGGSFIDANESHSLTSQNIDGRIINPPFLYGCGSIELLAREMTRDLQTIKNQALQHPDKWIELVSKGVHFGRLRADRQGQLDTSEIHGIEAQADVRDFLVVRPFGRKGEHATIRDFAVHAMQFHFGMEPVEMVGENVDHDNDGVTNEISIGQISALSVFIATLDPPRQKPLNSEARLGQRLFTEIGCSECHTPVLQTESPELIQSFPEIHTDPDRNVFYRVNLADTPGGYQRNAAGGLAVPLYADLRLHHMGAELAEADGNDRFTTARLWGIADSAPYLHDGRALTIMDAIMQHGGIGSDARDSVDKFQRLAVSNQQHLLSFLNSLRTPRQVSQDLNGMTAVDTHLNDF